MLCTLALCSAVRLGVPACAQASRHRPFGALREKDGEEPEEAKEAGAESRGEEEEEAEPKQRQLIMGVYRAKL